MVGATQIMWQQIVAVGRKEPYLYHHPGNFGNLPNFAQLGQIIGYEEPYTHNLGYAFIEKILNSVSKSKIKLSFFITRNL